MNDPATTPIEVTETTVTTTATETAAATTTEIAAATTTAAESTSTPAVVSSATATSATVEEDAKALKNAFGFFGTSNSTLIRILGHRTPQQLASIQLAFQKTYRQDLIDRLESRTSGIYGETLVNACRSPVAYDVDLIRSAVGGGQGKKEGVLVEVLSRRSNTDLGLIRAVYRALYMQDLDDVIRSEFGSDPVAQRFMLESTAGTRDDAARRDVGHDADVLIKAAGSKFDPEKNDWISVFARSTDGHLKSVLTTFKEKHGKDFVEVAKKELKGDLERAVAYAAASVENPAGHVAELLETAMKGIGSNKRMMARVVTRNRGVMMEEVKVLWNEKNANKTLRQRIESESSGNLRKLLVAMINAD